MSISRVIWTTGKQRPSPLHPFHRHSYLQSHQCSGQNCALSQVLYLNCFLLCTHSSSTTSRAMHAKLTGRARCPFVQANMASLLLQHVIIMGVSYMHCMVRTSKCRKLSCVYTPYCTLTPSDIQTLASVRREFASLGIVGMRSETGSILAARG